MITIARFSKPEDAHLLRMRLGAEGVRAFLQDEYIAQIYWLYSNAIGGVRVQIFESDLPRAKEILATEPAEPEPAAELECPKCGSPRNRPNETTRRLSFLSVLLLNFPLPVAKFSFVCEDCGHRWNDRKASE